MVLKIGLKFLLQCIWMSIGKDFYLEEASDLDVRETSLLIKKDEFQKNILFEIPVT